jgi:hypothetical protein
MDSNYWGLFVVPVGLLICFTPLVIAAILTKSDEQPAKQHADKKKH